MSFMKNKIVFVTGASSGVGRACARAFAREGASLLLAARRAARLKELAESLAAEFGAAVLPFALATKPPWPGPWGVFRKIGRPSMSWSTTPA
mgnify:CR=1 FL=1